MNWQDKRLKYMVIFLVALMALVGYRVFNNIMASKAKANKTAKGAQVAVATGHAERRTIVPLLKLSGTLDPVWQADIAAKVAGRLEQVQVDVGTRVQAGQLLAVLDSGELAATANSAQGSVYDAKANLNSAETILARNKQLYAAGALAKAELDSAQFNRDMAAGKLAAAEGSYANAVSRVQGTSVTTPQAGTIVKRYYQEGYYANVGTALFKVADTSQLVVKLNIPEGQIQSVQVGTPVEVTIPAMQGTKVKGFITKVATVADLPERTFAAEVTVDNSQNQLRGGLFADLVVTAQPKEQALTIPEQAIVMREDQRTVYVVDAEGRVSRKVLSTGFIGDGLVEVLGGITEQEELVLTGQNKVREGSTIKREQAEDK